jgi:septal ring factor EnvC (AmiA/AmiB activator)
MSDRVSQRQDDAQSRIAALEAELSQLRAERDRAEHEREQYRKLYTLVLYELERLKRQLFGKKAETVDTAQVQLAFGPVLDALARAETGAPDAQEDVQSELQKLREAAERARGGSSARDQDARSKGHGRRNFDAERAPVETIVLEPPERSLPGGEQLIKIGEEVSERGCQVLCV